MKAGFAKVRITPPLETMMMGWAGRDHDHGCEAIHDDLFVRALFLEHQGEEVLIMGYDLCFLGREEADQYKGAIGRKIDLAPRQILLNTSHTHDGPSVGTWAYAGYTPPDRLYLHELESATVSAACQAREATCEVTLWAGATRSAVPMSRRRRGENGKVVGGPNPEGIVCDSLPICLLKDTAGKPVFLLFSVSCHPSTKCCFDISADYPGVAMNQLDAHLGAVGSLFLQGCGGDAKASVIGQGQEKWKAATWEDVAQAGNMAAQEVIQCLEAGLTQIEPAICTHLIDMEWPLAPAMERPEYETLLKGPETDDLKRLWAERQLALLDRRGQLPTSALITAHGVQLGKGLRLIGLEGEAVAELGILIQQFYGDGITFPLGYTDGAQLYLPTSRMIEEEGGYEVVSYWEYGYPAPLAPGLEGILTETLGQLRARRVG